MSLKLLISRPNGEHSSPFTVPQARRAIRKQLGSNGFPDKHRARLRVRGEEFGTWRDKMGPLLDRWGQLVQSHDKAGDAVAIDIEDHAYSIVSRWVEITPPSIQTDGNEDIDRIYTYMVRTYSGASSGGICVYKIILDGNGRPTGTYSEHCNWSANNPPPLGPGADACDIFLPTMTAMKNAAADLVVLSSKFFHGDQQVGLPVGRIIVDNDIWERDQDSVQGWGPYYGERHYHIHIEGRRWLRGSLPRDCP